MPESHRSSDGRASLAVALRQQTGSDPTRVVAHGRGRAAQQILELAFANGVKVREDADLAQVLGALDLDSPIPLEAFAAVAEILVYVHQANRKITVEALAQPAGPAHPVSGAAAVKPLP